jgi:hypothetical protein
MRFGGWVVLHNGTGIGDCAVSVSLLKKVKNCPSAQTEVSALPMKKASGFGSADTLVCADSTLFRYNVNNSISQLLENNIARKSHEYYI